MTTNGRTAIAYVRVSSDRNRQETLQSPEIQLAAIRACAEARGIEIVGTFEDRNRSGATMTRAGMTAAREGVRRGDYRGIVVAHGARASRDVLQGLGMVDELEQLGGFILAADGTIDTSTPMARMATTMNFAMSEKEIRDTRAKAAEIHQRAITVKLRHMGPAPFGYRRNSDARLAVHPEEAAVVRWIFEQRADGRGWAAISRDLDERGVRDEQGRRITPQRVRGIVGRRTYLGEAFHGPHVVSGAHEAIVDDVLYEAANRAVPAVASPRRSTRPLLLGGLVRCAGCSYGMKASRQRSGSFAWACRARREDRTAAHECACPALVSAGEHDELQRIVIEGAKEIAAGVFAETDETVVAERAQRDLVEAEALLDELNSLDVRDSLGPERWAKLIREAGDRRGRAAEALQVVRRQSRGDQRRVWLADTFDELDFEDRREALRSIVKAVMVVGSEGALAGRVHVLAIDDPVELPRQGQRSVARRWVP
jgi:site-specific DNA recombinase